MAARKPARSRLEPRANRIPVGRKHRCRPGAGTAIIDYRGAVVAAVPPTRHRPSRWAARRSRGQRCEGLGAGGTRTSRRRGGVGGMGVESAVADATRDETPRLPPHSILNFAKSGNTRWPDERQGVQRLCATRGAVPRGTPGPAAAAGRRCEGDGPWLLAESAPRAPQPANARRRGLLRRAPRLKPALTLPRLPRRIRFGGLRKRASRHRGEHTTR